MSSKLIVTRKLERFNHTKPFRVFINGEEKGILKNADTVEYELDPGIYDLQLKHNWMSGSLHPVDLAQNSNTYVSVSNGMKYIGPLYIMMLAGLFFPFFLKIAKLPIPDASNIIKLFLIVPALIYMLLYISVFRNRYIEISEDKSHPFSN